MLMAPWTEASLVISRMTESVNRLTLGEMYPRVFGSGGLGPFTPWPWPVPK
jgi:hypothetical protein